MPELMPLASAASNASSASSAASLASFASRIASPAAMRTSRGTLRRLAAWRLRNPRCHTRSRLLSGFNTILS